MDDTMYDTNYFTMPIALKDGDDIGVALLWVALTVHATAPILRCITYACNVLMGVSPAGGG